MFAAEPPGGPEPSWEPQRRKTHNQAYGGPGEYVAQKSACRVRFAIRATLEAQNMSVSSIFG